LFNSVRFNLNLFKKKFSLVGFYFIFFPKWTEQIDAYLWSSPVVFLLLLISLETQANKKEKWSMHHWYSFSYCIWKEKKNQMIQFIAVSNVLASKFNFHHFKNRIHGSMRQISKMNSSSLPWIPRCSSHRLQSSGI